MSDNEKTNDIVTRTISTSFTLTRAVGEQDNCYIVEGIAATYGPVSGDRLIVDPGAFEPTKAYIQEGKRIKVLNSHNELDPLGVVSGIIFDDPKGIPVTLSLPKEDTKVAGRIIPQVRVGSMDSLSMRVRILDGAFDTEGFYHIIRCILEEVSICVFPADDRSVITSYRSLDIDAFKEKSERDIERMLRDGVKLSRSSSTLVASLIAKHFQRESEDEQRESVERMRQHDEWLEKMLNNFQTITNHNKE